MTKSYNTKTTWPPILFRILAKRSPRSSQISATADGPTMGNDSRGRTWPGTFPVSRARGRKHLPTSSVSAMGRSSRSTTAGTKLAASRSWRNDGAVRSAMQTGPRRRTVPAALVHGRFFRSLRLVHRWPAGARVPALGDGLRTGRPYLVCAEAWPSETRRQILKQPCGGGGTVSPVKIETPGAQFPAPPTAIDRDRPRPSPAMAGVGK